MNDADVSNAAPEFLFDLADVSTDIERRDIEGVWCGQTKDNPYLPAGFEVCVIGFMSPSIKALQIALSNGRNKETYDRDPLKTEERNVFENEQIAMAALKNWRSTTADGRKLPVAPFLGEIYTFSRPNKEKLLRDPRLWKLRVGIIRAMNDADEAAIAYVRSAEKNSGAGSAASSTVAA